MVWQLVFLVLLGVGLASVFVQNLTVTQQTISLAFFGETFTTTLRTAALILAGGWVLMLIGGMLDLAGANASAERYRTMLHDRELELARVKAEAYDRGRGQEDHLRGRLDVMDRHLAYLRERIDTLLRVTELPEEVRPAVSSEGLPERPIEAPIDVRAEEQTEIRREVRR